MEYEINVLGFDVLEKERKLSKTAIVKDLKITRPTYDRWRSMGYVPLKYLFEICRIYNVPITLFVKEKGTENASTLMLSNESMNAILRMKEEQTSLIKSYESKLKALEIDQIKKENHLTMEYRLKINDLEREIADLKGKLGRNNLSYPNAVAEGGI